MLVFPFIKINVLKSGLFSSRSTTASTNPKGKLQSNPWMVSLVAGLLWVEITRVALHADQRDFCKPPCCNSTRLPLGLGAARWDLQHLGGTTPKLLLCPGKFCPGLASALPGFVAWAGKLSSKVSAASAPRSKQKSQRSLLWYFASSARAVPSKVFQ